MMKRAAAQLELAATERRDAWAAMSMIHEAVGLVVPPGALPSEEAINARWRPTFSKLNRETTENSSALELAEAHAGHRKLEHSAALDDFELLLEAVPERQQPLGLFRHSSLVEAAGEEKAHEARLPEGVVLRFVPCDPAVARDDGPAAVPAKRLYPLEVSDPFTKFQPNMIDKVLAGE